MRRILTFAVIIAASILAFAAADPPPPPPPRPAPPRTPTTTTARASVFGDVIPASSFVAAVLVLAVALVGSLLAAAAIDVFFPAWAERCAGEGGRQVPFRAYAAAAHVVPTVAARRFRVGVFARLAVVATLALAMPLVNPRTYAAGTPAFVSAARAGDALLADAVAALGIVPGLALAVRAMHLPKWVVVSGACGAVWLGIFGLLLPLGVPDVPFHPAGAFAVLLLALVFDTVVVHPLAIAIAFYIFRDTATSTTAVAPRPPPKPVQQASSCQPAAPPPPSRPAPTPPPPTSPAPPPRLPLAASATLAPPTPAPTLPRRGATSSMSSLRTGECSDRPSGMSVSESDSELLMPQRRRTQVRSRSPQSLSRTCANIDSALHEGIDDDDVSARRASIAMLGPRSRSFRDLSPATTGDRSCSPRSVIPPSRSGSSLAPLRMSVSRYNLSAGDSNGSLSVSPRRRSPVHTPPRSGSPRSPKRAGAGLFGGGLIDPSGLVPVFEGYYFNAAGGATAGDGSSK